MSFYIPYLSLPVNKLSYCYVIALGAFLSQPPCLAQTFYGKFIRRQLMKILAFAATSSSKSINNKLVRYAASQLEDVSPDEIQTEILDINDYELPLFSEDREIDLGQPQFAKDFLQKITNSDALIISFAEHNGSYTVAYKNIFDWASRINQKVFQNKPMIMLATSPGPGGASREPLINYVISLRDLKRAATRRTSQQMA